jgi:protein-S-isoprenylcysteine O-methyltransferase Ste14
MTTPLYVRSPYVYTFLGAGLVLAARELLVRRYVRGDQPAVDDTRPWLVLWGATAAGTTVALVVPFAGVGMVPAQELAFWLGLAVMLAGYLLRMAAVLTLGELFSHRVVVAPDQAVVEEGPYRWVRHPAYTGAVVTYVGIGLACGNWLSLAAATVGGLVGFGHRVLFEERVLLRELDGYEAYTERVPHRLVPYLW